MKEWYKPKPELFKNSHTTSRYVTSTLARLQTGQNTGPRLKALLEKSFEDNDMTDELVVYTMAIGAKFDLNPPIAESGVEYICFSDRDDIDPNGWTMRPWNSIIPTDPMRSSREIKLCPHRTLCDHRKSIYVDSKIRLTAPASTIWKSLITNEDQLFGGFYHSFRETLEGEFAAIKRLRLDHAAIVDEQLEAYRESFAPILREQPFWGGFLARRHLDPRCVRAMETWFAHVLRFSRRDQLSMPIALSQLNPEQKHILATDIKRSEFHRWPVTKVPRPDYHRVSS